MLLICAILVWAAIQPRMRGDSVPSEEYLNSRPCQPDLYLLLDILVGNRVIHSLHCKNESSNRLTSLFQWRQFCFKLNTLAVVEKRCSHL